jgi:hypothetical protein
MVIAEIVLYFSVILGYIFYKLFAPAGARRKAAGTPRHAYDAVSRRIAGKSKSTLKAHYGFLVFLFITLFLALTISITWLLSTLQKVLIFTDPNTIYLGYSWAITALPVLPICLCLSNLILESLPFRSARLAADRYYTGSLPHTLDMKLTRWLLLGFFILGFPFVILNTDYYCSVTADAFCSHPFFSLSEDRYAIPGDIESVEVTYDTRSKNGYNFYYTLRFTNGEEAEVLNDNRFETEKVVALDALLAAHRVPIARASFTERQWERTIEDDYTREVTESLRQLYLIE